jgi:hypothetical protein
LPWRQGLTIGLQFPLNVWKFPTSALIIVWIFTQPMGKPVFTQFSHAIIDSQIYFNRSHVGFIRAYFRSSRDLPSDHLNQSESVQTRDIPPSAHDLSAGSGTILCSYSSSGGKVTCAFLEYARAHALLL